MMWTRLVSPLPLSVSNHPAHGGARRERPRARQLLARLERNIGDLAWRGINLIKRARAIGKDLDGVEVAGAPGLHSRDIVGHLDAIDRLLCLHLAFVSATRW